MCFIDNIQQAQIGGCGRHGWKGERMGLAPTPIPTPHIFPSKDLYTWPFTLSPLPAHLLDLPLYNAHNIWHWLNEWHIFLYVVYWMLFWQGTSCLPLGPDLSKYMVKEGREAPGLAKSTSSHCHGLQPAKMMPALYLWFSWLCDALKTEWCDLGLIKRTARSK